VGEKDVNREAYQVVWDGVTKGPEDIVDHALRQWYSRAYGDDKEMNSENIQRWHKIREDIRPIISYLKACLKDYARRG
jgi:hypothetical protein